MATDRSDQLYASWRESSEKFDYFILGVICALCAYIGQGYRAAPLGVNSATLELLSLLFLVLGVVAGFRRIEKVLQMGLMNHKQLHAYEARGGLAAKLPHGQPLINNATGDIYSPADAMARIHKLTEEIEHWERQIEPVKTAAVRSYHLRNNLTLIGFLGLIAARVWAAYT